MLGPDLLLSLPPVIFFCNLSLWISKTSPALSDSWLLYSPTTLNWIPVMSTTSLGLPIKRPLIDCAALEFWPELSSTLISPTFISLLSCTDWALNYYLALRLASLASFFSLARSALDLPPFGLSVVFVIAIVNFLSRLTLGTFCYCVSNSSFWIWSASRLFLRCMRIRIFYKIVTPHRYFVTVISFCQYLLPHKELSVTSRSSPLYLFLNLFMICLTWTQSLNPFSLLPITE